MFRSSMSIISDIKNTLSLNEPNLIKSSFHRENLDINLVRKYNKEIDLNEIVELVKEMEEKFDVSASNMMMCGNIANNTQKEEVKEQTEFSVTLESFGASKISVIKSIRSVISVAIGLAR